MICQDLKYGNFRWVAECKINWSGSYFLSIKKGKNQEFKKGENGKWIRRDCTECLVTVGELIIHDELGVWQGRRGNQVWLLLSLSVCFCFFLKHKNRNLCFAAAWWLHRAGKSLRIRVADLGNPTLRFSTRLPLHWMKTMHFSVSCLYYL